MKLSLAFPLGLVAAASLAFAHGDDAPGPHGGFIRMPGRYHTEVVPSDPTEFKVYLLDIRISHPTVARSSVSALLASGTAPAISITCTPKTDYFSCGLPAGASLDSAGQLALTTNRAGEKGLTATYALPLKLTIK